MRIIHTSDLHLGKKVHEYSMIEDQAFILDRIIDNVKRQEADALLISGDVYDKSLPSEAAINLLNDFLIALSEMDLPVFIIPGNHDSADRLSFGNWLMAKSSVFIQGPYTGKIRPHYLHDEFGKLAIYSLPFIRPSAIKSFFPDRQVDSYEDAVRLCIEDMDIDRNIRNIILAHQFVAGASRTDSEILSLGGTDSISPSLFKDFDYVALGHIHRPQKMGADHIRYSGSPLKYSISEQDDKKSLVQIDLLDKGNIGLSFLPLKPLRDLREIRGKYDQILLKDNYKNTNTDDYVHIVLEDELEVPNAMANLSLVYPNILKLDYDNLRTQAESGVKSLSAIEKRSEMDLLREFYLAQNGVEMSTYQEDLSISIFKEISEEKA